MAEFSAISDRHPCAETVLGSPVRGEIVRLSLPANSGARFRIERCAFADTSGCRCQEKKKRQCA